MKTTEINGKMHCAHGLEEWILLKWPYYPRQSTDSTPIKIPMKFFHRTRTNNFKICMETQKTQTAK